MNTNGTTTKTTRPSREKVSIYIYIKKKKKRATPEKEYNTTGADIRPY